MNRQLRNNRIKFVSRIRKLSESILKLNPITWGPLKGFEIIFIVDYEPRFSIVSIRVCYLVSLTSKI